MEDEPLHSNDLELVAAGGNRVDIADFIPSEPYQKYGKDNQSFVVTIPISIDVGIGDWVEVIDKKNGAVVIGFEIDSISTHLKGEEFQRLEGSVIYDGPPNQ